MLTSCLEQCAYSWTPKRQKVMMQSPIFLNNEHLDQNKVPNLRSLGTSVREDQTRSVAGLSAAVGLNCREIFSICSWDPAKQSWGRQPTRSSASKNNLLRCPTTTLRRLQPPPGALPDKEADATSSTVGRPITTFTRTRLVQSTPAARLTSARPLVIGYAPARCRTCTCSPPYLNFLNCSPQDALD
jgi:hypothetical protein